MDLEQLIDDESELGNLKLASVIRMHYPDMRKSLEKSLNLISESEVPVGDSNCQSLQTIFEDRVN